MFLTTGLSVANQLQNSSLDFPPTACPLWVFSVQYSHWHGELCQDARVLNKMRKMASVFRKLVMQMRKSSKRLANHSQESLHEYNFYL